MLNCLNNSFLFVSYDNCRVNEVVLHFKCLVVVFGLRNAMHATLYFFLVFNSVFHLCYTNLRIGNLSFRKAYGISALSSFYLN